MQKVNLTFKKKQKSKKIYILICKNKKITGKNLKSAIKKLGKARCKTKFFLFMGKFMENNCHFIKK